MGMVAYLDGVRIWMVHTVGAGIVIILLCVTNITTTCICHKHDVRHTPKQRKLDRLKSEFKGATNETSTGDCGSIH